MEDLVKKIVAKHIPCYFISPHLDDVILSAGALVSYLSKKTKIHAITVFTEGGDMYYGRSARNVLKASNHTNARELFEERRKEDREVFTKIGIQPVDLGYIDGAFRKTAHPNGIQKILARFLPDVLYLYPFGTMRGILVREDEKIYQRIQNDLRKIVLEKNAIIFAPLGIGGHIDHILTREVCMNTFSRVFFWTDYPYILHKKNVVPTKAWGLSPQVWNKNLEVKKDLIRMYKSQVSSLFPDAKIPMIEEVYYHSGLTI